MPGDDRQANPHLAQRARAGAFDLVAELYTVQALYGKAREAGSRLTARSAGQFLDDEDPPKLRWRAEFSRG